ncbi:MAG: lipoyl(octanoyl) transferase LipB [Rikenellaceae bacterium]|jgi:lipoyl(octanoyl) transferase|nr:lipoyl(octanoyl) transferase LipB [Rikenellaceae bacterium]MBQ5893785.1 lipoyl(octanoyl) transferase LipB [Rikenellaceae bacterium]
MKPTRAEYRDLGLIDYEQAWELQRSLFDGLLARKSAAARRNEGDVADAATSWESSDEAGYVLLCEHEPVYTLGKSGHKENLLFTEALLRQIGATFYHIDRGGDVTFHGPGQIVGYPIIDLEKLGIGLRDYIAAIEQSVIDCVAEYGIVAGRLEGAAGVWITEEGRPPRKICAIGVRSSRYVTMHGFALNVATDLKYFTYINPCGFVDRGVCSIESEVGHKVDLEEVKAKIINCLEKNLNVKIYKN